MELQLEELTERSASTVESGRTQSRDRDLTVKGSRHLTFHITVKLTIKEDMLN